MKNLSAFRFSLLRFPFLTLSAAFALTLPIQAADPIEAHWNDVCQVASGQQLILTTADGATTEGYCVRINADEMDVTTLDHRTIKIARRALASLQLRRINERQLRTLGKGLRSSLKAEVGWLLSPAATAGLVAIPATLAWGAVSAPFCALGDLVDHLSPRQRDLKVVADSTPVSAH